jgi:hypothetical protein
MSNIRNSNTYYIDSASVSLDVPGVQVIGIIVTGDGGAAELELADNVAGASYPSKMNFQAASGATIHIDLADSPIVFPNGIRVVTATTVKATLILRESKV